MSQIVKLYEDVLYKRRDKNIRFQEFQRLILALGFVLDRIKGDHFIYVKDDIPEIINIQPDKRDSSKAKSVQVSMLRDIIIKYELEV